MQHLLEWEEFNLNEKAMSSFKEFNLGLKSYQYQSDLEKLLKGKVSEIEYISDSSDDVLVITKFNMHNIDLTKKIQSALNGFDSNLDLDNITNDFNADDDHRSPHNIKNGITKYKIPKKIDYWTLYRSKDKKNLSSPETEITDEIVFDLVDIMAQYSSKGHTLADYQWKSLETFLNSASDLMSKTNFTKYKKEVIKKYPKLK